jgi:hypothetical protein
VLVKKWTVCVVFVALAASGCGGCGDETGGGGVDVGSTDGGAVDVGPEDVGRADVGASDGGGRGADSGPADVGGFDGGSADGGGADVGTSCGIYSDLCDGACIPTNTDPDNCGGCGVVCGAAEVCFGGRCIDECQSGLTECDRRCVDPRSDNANCGACGSACGAGEGCVEEECVDAIDVDPGAVACDGGGPPVDLGDGLTTGPTCAGNLAELTFRFGVCACGQFDINNALLVDAFDSSAGPYQPGGLGGGVGVNGGLVANNGADVSGALWVAGDAGVTANGDLDVGLSLLTGGDLRSNHEVSVGRDATVEGSLSANDLSVADTLTLPTGATAPGSVSFGALVNADVDVAAPCDACPPSALDVPGIVAAFSDPALNDNAAIGLDADVFDPATNAPNRLDLPCGRYYLSGVQANRALTIVANGNTALFIDGDITANNALTITLTPDAQLDVFISGDVVNNNSLTLGSPDYPALMRVYVGGAGGFVANNPVTVGGYLYVVPGDIRSNNELEVFGGIYANEITANNPWRIHYDRRVATVGDGCDDPRDPDPDPDADAGMGDAGGDAGPGPGPTCGLQNDACGASGDCCAPLSCVGGTCQQLDCSEAFQSCATSADCCSGLPCSGGADGICIVN